MKSRSSPSVYLYSETINATWEKYKIDTLVSETQKYHIKMKVILYNIFISKYNQ